MECSPDTSFQPVFEVAESALIQYPDYWRPVCERYRRNGFRLALTYGAADAISIRTLLDIRPDYIKLEKALVGDIETLPSSLAIRKLADLGEYFRIPVVADGVDRRITAENLWLLNVSLMQGPLCDAAATPAPNGSEFRLGYWPSHSTPPSRTSKASARRVPRCWRRRVSKLLKIC
jgi:EAL domain-containing protein (putative c-di-GMP-specific phosphodiesterase class I)